MDGKAHDFPSQPDVTACCSKCKMTKEQVDTRCRMCGAGEHEWVQALEPLPNATGPPPQPGVAQGVPMLLVYKCPHCGMRRQAGEDGIYHCARSFNSTISQNFFLCFRPIFCAAVLLQMMITTCTVAAI